LKVVLVGARSARQGTGPFLAAGLAQAGAHISGIVGTTEETVAAARKSLFEDSGLHCKGYTDLSDAIARKQPDAVVLCSPWQFHAEQLEVVAAAHCHCLIEKPLTWPATETEVDALIGAFEQRQRLLQMVAQWPCTLPFFTELHGAMPEKVDQFTMRLSPISIGPAMVTDSAPHFISLLQALVGPGDFEQIDMQRIGDEALIINCHYRHRGGMIAASLQLENTIERPRPAWYQVNALRADREVALPEYRQYFVAGNSRVELGDPMHEVARSFVQNIEKGKPTDGAVLRCGHRNLLQLARAWPE